MPGEHGKGPGAEERTPASRPLSSLGRLRVARGFIWHRLRPGGQCGAVALAGQHPPGLVSRLCRLPHLKAVAADSGKLLPVTAGSA